MFGYLLFSAILFSLGMLARNFLFSACKLEKPGGSGGFDLFWIGLSILIILLEGISLFSPIDGVVFAVFLVLCAPAIPIAIKQFTLPRREILSYVMIGGTILVFIIAASITSHGISAYDTRNYHFNAVKWITDFSVVPGVANISPYMGYNNSFHIFAGFVDVWLWEARSAHVALSLVYSMAVVQFFQAGVKSIFQETTREGVYALLVLPFVVGYMFSDLFNSLSPDPFSQILCLLLGFYLIKLSPIISRAGFLYKVSIREPVFGSFIVVFLLATMAITNKLSGFPGILVLLLLLIPAYFNSEIMKGQKKAIHILLCVAALAAFVHMGRSIALTGWLWYPVPFGNFHLPWSVPYERGPYDIYTVKGMNDIIIAHGRGWHYQENWSLIDYLIRTKAHPAFILMYMGVAFLLGSFLLKARRITFKEYVLPLLMGFSGIWYLWLTVPSMRFGIQFFWGFFVVCALPFFFNMPGRKAWVVPLIALGIYNWSVFREKNYGLWPPSHYIGLPKDGGRTGLKKMTVQPRDGSPAFEIYYTGELQGNSVLPVTQLEAHQLVILKERVPGDLSSGYEFAKSLKPKETTKQ